MCAAPQSWHRHQGWRCLCRARLARPPVLLSSWPSELTFPALLAPPGAPATISALPASAADSYQVCMMTIQQQRALEREPKSSCLPSKASRQLTPDCTAHLEGSQCNNPAVCVRSCLDTVIGTAHVGQQPRPVGVVRRHDGEAAPVRRSYRHCCLLSGDQSPIWIWLAGCRSARKASGASGLVALPRWRMQQGLESKTVTAGRRSPRGLLAN